MLSVASLGLKNQRHNNCTPLSKGIPRTKDNAGCLTLLAIQNKVGTSAQKKIATIAIPYILHSMILDVGAVIAYIKYGTTQNAAHCGGPVKLAKLAAIQTPACVYTLQSTMQFNMQMLDSQNVKKTLLAPTIVVNHPQHLHPALIVTIHLPVTMGEH
jgi:hypothetical protein